MAYKNNQVQPLTEVELQKREEALVTAEATLKKGQEQLAADQEALKKDQEKLATDQKELQKREDSLKKAEKENKPAKAEPGLKFEFQGMSKKFKDSAPKAIRYDGKIWTQEELIDEENTDAVEALTDLVSSNSNYIENI